MKQSDKRDNLKVINRNYLALGLSLGIIIGFAFDNIGIGLAFGVAIGKLFDTIKHK